MVYEGTRRVGVHEVEDAVVEEPTDVVVRITSSAMCGTDLHMYDGRTGARPGLVLGHEPLGVVEKAGPAVTMVAPGDRVVMPTHLYCGVCPTCARGLTAACTRVRPGGFGAAYGYAGMGPYRGAQAELLRVPYADANCMPLPGSPGDAYEDAFVLLADAFVTGWHACELAGTGPGDSVAVFGAGAVGLLAAHSAVLRGAAEVYVVDHLPERLAVAADFGALPVDTRDGDPGEQIRSLRNSGGGMPPGEAGLDGVTCGIDAVGFQARSRADLDQEDPRQVIDDLAAIVNPTGRIGVAGVFAAHDAHPAPHGHADGTLQVPWAVLFDKGVRVGFGRTHDRRYTRLLRDLILTGRAEPQRVVTHHGPLEDAPAFYTAFDRREDGVIKAVLHP
ncbi:alcohol dehydrogenase [Streptantibioticus cattleyicolor NRRL 8057 = DSM 46488]|uniref:Alcohol dehydrogenase n=1 Tax=Streptantibioticus cattleyicolor (strain ATCC 35852 / DSM 46488 / JCM 4925 / NBRC 14057 / NRRL 8057) TaxID=1003195 RepID=F8JNR9_STREN|nr:alcohol dehydrogenase [Streptantibioticus cattleyicolor NRRL 8057 = DSM 46488]MYS57425.1 alcohol dehydrogenase catalytic domain-containing protein [Streptomyces sp. SID5468]CCB73004.1 Theronine dehydrogenase-like Zn-dependent dehydrogenase [Streptantibioticus cattleyicolor NRRL 8057 = DSM 46488]